MRRRHVLLATGTAAALAGGLLLAPNATAQSVPEVPGLPGLPGGDTPQLCISLDLDIMGTGDTFELCLPPDPDQGLPGLPGLPGGETPGLPSLPGLDGLPIPGLEALPLPLPAI